MKTRCPYIDRLRTWKRLRRRRRRRIERARSSRARRASCVSHGARRCARRTYEESRACGSAPRSHAPKTVPLPQLGAKIPSATLEVPGVVSVVIVPGSTDREATAVGAGLLTKSRTYMSLAFADPDRLDRRCRSLYVRHCRRDDRVAIVSREAQVKSRRRARRRCANSLSLTEADDGAAGGFRRKPSCGLVRRRV